MSLQNGSASVLWALFFCPLAEVLYQELLKR